MEAITYKKLDLKMIWQYYDLDVLKLNPIRWKGIIGVIDLKNQMFSTQ